MIINRLSRQLAIHLKRVANHPEDPEVLAYPIIIFFNVLLTLFMALIVAAFLDQVYEVFLYLLAFALLRFFSGGLHLKSPELCIVLTALGANVLAALPALDAYVPVLNVLTLLLCLLYAPSNVQKQTNFPERYNPILKVIAIIIVSTNFWFNSSLLSAAWFIQALTLIRIGGDHK